MTAKLPKISVKINSVAPDIQDVVKTLCIGDIQNYVRFRHYGELCTTELHATIKSEINQLVQYFKSSGYDIFDTEYSARYVNNLQNENEQLKNEIKQLKKRKLV